MEQCNSKSLPGFNTSLGDIFSDISKGLGLDKALDQADATTQAIDKTNETVKELVTEAKSAWTIAKPVLLFFGIELAALMTITSIKNYQQIKK